MSWIFEEEIFTSDKIQKNVGYVYLIENILTGKKYIGKKLFKFRKTKQVNNKKKKVSVDSDWETYWSSSDSLKKDVKEFGEHNFKRTILKLCETKSECNYWEAHYQFGYQVLLYPDMFYNEWISVRVRRNQLLTSTHKLV